MPYSPAMTFPVDITIGSLSIPAHLFFEVLAMYIAIWLYLTLKKKENGSYDETGRQVLLIGAAAGAVIGSRGLAFLEHLDLFPGETTHSLKEWSIYLLSTKTIVGGLLGGIIGVELVKKFYLKSKLSSGDLFVFPLMLAMAIGRIGCFLTGVSDATAGLPSDLPWALDQGDGVLRHPTSLYDIFFLGILAASLWSAQKKIDLKNGVLFRLFIIFYMLYRFSVEFIKPVDPSLWPGLSVIQWAALSGALAYIYSLAKNGLVENKNALDRNETIKGTEHTGSTKACAARTDAKTQITLDFDFKNPSTPREKSAQAGNVKSKVKILTGATTNSKNQNIKKIRANAPGKADNFSQKK